MRDGRKRALAALAYQAGGLLHWSGLDEDDVISQLVAAGTSSGLSEGQSNRISRRSVACGVAAPLRERGGQPRPSAAKRISSSAMHQDRFTGTAEDQCSLSHPQLNQREERK
ncbi:hypothetical protein ABN028_32955 [Actinopolymorpha sp. B17G11]|uniref:hypothetical protein n=1 Tax=Actinopolymorpha sp. B17G11 TaxID=3160861 RepID=UPI0032E3CD65